MAHFAQLDENNVVLQVIVVNNDELMDGTDENEAKGIAFCQELLGSDTIWRQTSYNNNFRTRYAAVGGVYDPIKDAFISPKFFPSWVLNEETTEWEAPVPYPSDGNFYIWDENALSWVLVPNVKGNMSALRDLPPEEAP